MTNQKFNAQEEIGSALQFRISKLLSDTFPENHSVCEYKTDEQFNSFVFVTHTESTDLKDTSNPVVRARIHFHIHEINSSTPSIEDEEFIEDLRDNTAEGSFSRELIEKLIAHPDLLSYVSNYGEDDSINPLPTF